MSASPLDSGALPEPLVPAMIRRRLLLTVAEACEVLRISRWTFYQLVRQRQLPTVKIGSRRLVPSAAIGEFISRRIQEER
jgi:excisionase family DNA binding protein